MLEICAVSVIIILGVKELVGVGNHSKRVANLLYIPALPLLFLFGLLAFERISQIPFITG